MKIALIVPPFITVPPERYGGTELFVAHLAEGLRAKGHWPVVYTVGSSRVDCEIRWRMPEGHWPMDSALESSLEDLDHSSWACEDAARECDVLHLNNAPGLNLSRFIQPPMVYTVHHPHEPMLSRYYSRFPRVRFVCISRNQSLSEGLPNLSVVHHGLGASQYQVGGGSQDYLCFVGRIAPIKGTHTAIAVARQAGLPLKIAGEIQPIYRDYWEREIRPHLDGRRVEYVGEVDLAGKNQLFAGARALLFPIQWEEPFGLVMIEAMFCGVPVLAFAAGSAPEIVVDGVSGWICRDIADMARHARREPIPRETCRLYAEQHFRLDDMVDRYISIYQSCTRLQEDRQLRRNPVPLRAAS